MAGTGEKLLTSTSWFSVLLLVAVTFCYAGYNVFVKVSGSQVPAAATTTVLATICLQIAALLVSLLFFMVLVVRGGHLFQLGGSTYLWASVAGICIGLAEIGYFYLFAGLYGTAPMPANVAIPVIVSGTIVIAMIFSYFTLRESVSWNQVLGSLLIVTGIVLFFVKTSSSGNI